jgi:ATP-binding cassette subfamily B protein/subfamily B ATP-binding cassette protein MsbA
VYLRQGGVLETELPQTAPADPSSDGTRPTTNGALQ